MRIVIAGGSGFIGRALTQQCLAAGDSVTVLSRSGKAPCGATGLAWDARTVGPWGDAVRESDAVVNLAGERITVRWTEENRRRIVDSRTESAAAIGAALATVSEAKVWVNASAVGYYGNRGDETLTEASAVGTGFLAETCQRWEAAVDGFDLPNVRRVKVRIGFVLGRDGGAFPKLVSLTKAFLGGAVASGRQYVPWIHVDDLAAMIRFACEHPVGPVMNGTAPSPVTNAEFMGALRKALGRPWSPPVPALGLKVAEAMTGLSPSLVLDGAKVLPRAALDAGFGFRHPGVQSAIADLLSR